MQANIFAVYKHILLNFFANISVVIIFNDQVINIIYIKYYM